jgi:hypothetical protein
MRTNLRTLVLAAALIAPSAVVAQEMVAPPWLNIFREVVKPGKGLSHTVHEVAWARALEAAKYPGLSLGITSMSGPNESWWLNGFGSAADLEKANAAFAASPALAAVEGKFVPPEADFLNNGFGVIARLRDDLSYNSGRPMVSMRYMLISTVTVRPGHGDEFAEARRMIKAAHEKAKLVDGFAVYQVLGGGATGTFLVFQAKSSLAEFDTDPHGPAYAEALGGAAAQKKLADMAGSYTATSIVNLFRLDPQISVLNKAWYDADPFWRPKAASAPKK